MRVMDDRLPTPTMTHTRGEGDDDDDDDDNDGMDDDGEDDNDDDDDRTCTKAQGFHGAPPRSECGHSYRGLYSSDKRLERISPAGELLALMREVLGETCPLKELSSRGPRLLRAEGSMNS